MFAWWGRTVYRYRYIVIGVMVALCLGGGVFGISLGKHVTQSGFYDEGSQSVHASVVGRQGLRPRHAPATSSAIYTAPDGKTVDDPAFQKKILDNLPRSRRTTPTRSSRSVGYFKSPTNCCKNMADADKTARVHVDPAQGRQRRHDPEQLQGRRDARLSRSINDGVDVQLAGLQPLASELTGTIGDDQQRAEVLGACRWSRSCCSSCSAA